MSNYKVLDGAKNKSVSQCSMKIKMSSYKPSKATNVVR